MCGAGTKIFKGFKDLRTKEIKRKNDILIVYQRN